MNEFPPLYIWLMNTCRVCRQWVHVQVCEIVCLCGRTRAVAFICVDCQKQSIAMICPACEREGKAVDIDWIKEDEVAEWGRQQ